jgi:siroheme synthase-like protein
VVATRKVRALAEAEFEIVVVAPAVSDAIRTAPHVRIEERRFEPGDLGLAAGGFALVFACTDERDTNRTIGELARRAGIPVVVADAQRESTFFTPATMRDGELAIAVSTGGASPGVAKMIRARVATALGPGWGQAVSLARADRDERLRRRITDGGA